MISLDNIKIAVVGLGYVGLPLAVAFGRQYKTIGFDIKAERIRELAKGIDSTLEVEADELATVRSLTYTDREADLEHCNIYVVTVPTPVTSSKKPDLSPVESATRCIAKYLKKNDIVIYESTVYPGVTEEICAVLLEEGSGLELNKDFYLGYSPERINPGDKRHRIENIKKVTSGSTPAAADFIDSLYAKVITAGTYKASSIRVAEAAKVIENTQRDVNIALINELAMLFNKLDINTIDVLEAAGTKWNFLPFRPGLVGGHCIGVDPYYLTYKAQEVGFDPKIILSGRTINDGMGLYVVEQVIDLMTGKNIPIDNARILIMGFTFKENCPDVRNTRVIDMVEALKSKNAIVDVYEPWGNREEIEHEYAITPVHEPSANYYDAIIMAVAHDEFKTMGLDKIKSLGKNECIIYDIKNILPADQIDGCL
jgi:UDP-N-acetyl-D-galactosamine dehydrogenase